jgi:adenylyltransferase/sulfurtransferase
MPKKKISAEEYGRYQRHFSLREMGIAGQEKLKSSSALLVGAGGLGSPIAMYLVAAGIGRLVIVDFDLVDLSNLQRQILHGTSDIGYPKIASARRRLSELNPHVEILTLKEKLTVGNARRLISQCDVVIDATDNFTSRYLINDACYFEGRPLVSGAIFGFEGQVSVFHYEDGPCYRCLFPTAPAAEAAPNCSEAGVLGVLPGIIGTMQALEVLKIVVGFGEVLSSRIAYYNALTADITKLSLAKNPECPLCGSRPTILNVIAEDAVCVIGPHGDGTDEIRLADISPNDRDNIYLLDVRTIDERNDSAIPGSAHIPLAELELRYSEIPKDKNVVVYCQSGIRSRQAVERLHTLGYQSATSLQGGIVRWHFDSRIET